MLNYIGLDVSKHKLDCVWLKEPSAGKLKSKVFKNDRSGHQALLVWLSALVSKDLTEVVVTVEPTGVYHESLVYTLHESGVEVLLVNPGKAKAFAVSQNRQSKTDKKDSVMLALRVYLSQIAEVLAAGAAGSEGVKIIDSAFKHAGGRYSTRTESFRGDGV